MENNADIFRNWIDNYSAALLSRAFYLVSDKQDAEDLVQDVFIAAFEQINTFRNESSPKTWLMQILQYKTADFYRRKYKHSGTISTQLFFDEFGFWKDQNVLNDWNDEFHLMG